MRLFSSLMMLLLISPMAWAQMDPNALKPDPSLHIPGVSSVNSSSQPSLYAQPSTPIYSGSYAAPKKPANLSYLPHKNQACWDEAARYHGVDPWLLYAIGHVESAHRPQVISKPNSNGTRDIGLMQINSVHLPTLRRYGIGQETLLNACASTYVGAWVLAEKIRRYGYTWQAIAAYNVGSLDTKRRQQIGYNYARKVYAAYDQLSVQQNQRRSGP